MIQIGQYHKLIALRSTSVGFFLGNSLGDEILLPTKYVPEGLQVDDSIQVFVYKDSEDRPIATTLEPLAMPGEFAYLKVSDVTGVGAFLDIGLEKDLLVPYKEQNQNLDRDMHVLVYVYLDETTQRMVASCKINRFLDQDLSELEIGDEVQVLVGRRSDIGYRVIVNNRYNGMIYTNEVFESLRAGERKKAFIQKIREDGKLDIGLQPAGYAHIDRFEQMVLDAIEKHGGTLPLGDKSPPEEIYDELGMSKKNFKKAVGALYKAKKITLSPTSIEAIRQTNS